MPDLFNADGEAVEDTMTQEDADKKIEDAVGEMKQTLQEEIDTLREETKKQAEEYEKVIGEKDQEIEKVGSAGYNFKKMREEKAKSDKIAEELKGTIKSEVDQLRTEIKGSKIEDAVKRLSGGDTELGDKIKFHFGNFKGDPADQAEFNQRMNNAHLLAVGSRPINPLGAEAIGTGPGAPSIPSSTGKMSDETKDMGKKFLGLSDQDLAQAGQ